MARYYIPLVGTPQIGEGGGGGGSDLPAVTSEDNGDVLTVVNGAWDKAAPSGGGGVLVVNTTETDGVVVCDKTAGEMVAALESGGIIFRQYTEGVYYYDSLVDANVLDGERYVFETQASEFLANSASDYPQAGGN